MKEQRITIEIDDEGRITADADGFSGDACLGELNKLLEELAPDIALIDRKPDTGVARVKSARTQMVGKTGGKKR